MFILHVKHYFFREILTSLLAKKDAESAFVLRLLPANYKIFEVPVLVFARASGNAVSAVRPWDRGWAGSFSGLSSRIRVLAHMPC